MAEGSMKQYQVDYLITIQDQASESLSKLATTVQNITKPFENIQGAAGKLQQSINDMKNVIEKGLVLTPTIHLESVQDQLTKLEEKARVAAGNISTMLGQALSGTYAKPAKVDNTKEGIKKTIKNNKEAIRELYGETTKEGKVLKQRNEKLKAQLKEGDFASALSTTINSYSNIANKAASLEKAVVAIENINKAIAGAQGVKPQTVKIDADISPAVTKLNTLLETIRTNVAAVPVTIAEAGKKGVAGTKGGKAVSSKTGQITKVGAANAAIAQQNSISTMENVLKSKGKTVDIIPKFNGSALIATCEESIANLQKLTKERPIVLRGVFNGSDAGYQLNQSISNLQKIAKEHPIVLRGIFNGGDAGFQLNQAISNLQKLASEHPIATQAAASAAANTVINNNAASTVSSTSNTVKAMEKAQEKSDRDFQKAKDKAERNMAQVAHASRQSEYTAMGQELAAQDKAKKAAEKAQLIAQNNAQKEAEKAKRAAEKEQERADKKYQKEQERANKNMAQIAHASRQADYDAWAKELDKRADRAGRSNARELERLRATSTPYIQQKSSTQGRLANYRGGSSAMAKPTDLYTRAKTSLYPFTGNTSFGARTPMAIDMAKGMGTMFAIGGAMSAIGNSLHQSVAYQNTMKTTQAILQNGTKTYSDSGFKNMENVVRQVGKETKFTAPQVASAAKFLAMAGYDTDDIKRAINPVANIALIGDTNLGETADKLTNVMTTFGINPKDMNNIADIMTSTFTRSNTDMMMLAESAKYAGGIAHLYGGKFQNNFSDVMAMFGILGNAGIQASSAGTTLRMMYQNLMQPNKNQTATLKKYGIYTRDASGSPLEMFEILKQINAKVPQEELADAVGNMFRITAQPGAAALVQNVANGKLLDLMMANRNSAGSGVSQTIADEKKNTLAGLWAQVESTFTEGVLQALENREGGWAGQLMKLRDYLAKPETVEMLSSIVDLVEDLMRVMAQFAKFYTQIYHAFPGLIQWWMRVQLYFTQLGYLITPIVQLLGIFNLLKTSLLGTAAASSVAAAAERRRQMAISGGVVASVLGGGSSIVGRGAAVARSSKVMEGLVAANIAGGYVSRKMFRPYSQFSFAPRPDILGPLSLVRGGYQENPNVTEQIKTYERSRNMKRDMPKRERMRLNATINRRIAELKTKQYSPVPMTILPLGLGFGKPTFLHGRELRSIEYNRAAVSHVNPFNQYASATGAVLYGAAPVASRFKNYKNRAAQWYAISGYKSLSAEKRAAAFARAEKYTDAALQARRMENEALATRGKITKGMVARRFWRQQFNAGRAVGAINMASIIASLKGLGTRLLGAIVKGFGMIVSKLGLIGLAIGLVSAAAYGIYKKIQDRKKAIATAESNKKRIENQRKNIAATYKDISNSVYGLKPVNIDLPKPNVPAPSKKVVKPSLAKNEVASALLDEKAMGDLTWGEIYNKYVEPAKYYLPNDYHYTKDSVIRSGKMGTMGASRLGVVAQWAMMATQQQDVKDAITNVQTALKNKDLNLAQRIVESYKPVSNVSMLGGGRTAKDIAQLDPTKFYEWQYAQYKMLKDSLDMQSKFSQALDLIDDFKGKSKKEQKNYDGTTLAQTLIQSIPIAINGTTTSISLDKMGHVDWYTLAKSVNNGIPFTIEQQAKILDNVYQSIYDNPNIKNSSSIIDLLKTYLPKIAQAENPYDDFYWTDWGEAASDAEKKARAANAAQAIQIPFEPSQQSVISQWGTNGWGIPTVSVPTVVNSFDKAMSESSGSIIEKTVAWHKKQNAGRTTRTGASPSGMGKGGSYGGNNGKTQKDYKNTYDRSASRPTQVIINIDKLANFDRTAIAKNADERAITNAIETKIAEAVSMLSAQILNTASSTISQGV